MMVRKWMGLSIFLVSLYAVAEEPGYVRHQLVYEEPAMVWDEAFPLGNGLLGALVWGDGHPLNISLDRTDLWDLRPVPEFHSEEYSYETMKKWVEEGRIEDLRRVYEEPYNRAGPTKIPAGRIEIGLGEGADFERGVLSLADGVATLAFSDGTRAQVWVDATQTSGRIRIETDKEVHPNLKAPAFGGATGQKDGPAISAGELGKLGYDPPQETTGENSSAFLQEGWDEFKFAVALTWEQEGGAWRGAWSIATSRETEDPLALAKERAKAGLAEDDTENLKKQETWWKDYWEEGFLSVPNETLERQWFLEMYKFGAATRRATPPITLQGPWTADDGKLPPWKGDYHHDLNTELSYWPCYSANRLEEGLGYIDWLWKTRDNCADWTKRFYDLPGMNVPMTADLENSQIGGWHQYTHSGTTACWLAHHFYLHWRYSMDWDFLKDRLYPYISEIAIFLESLMVEDKEGHLTLELSSSPEIHDNKLEAWFKTITNYDLALIRWTFEKSAELATELGIDDEAERWLAIHKRLPEIAVSEEGFLLVSQDQALEHSHRHHSHLMAYHPLGLINWENGEKDRRIIQATMKEMDRLGTSQWCGYSFSWQGNLWARAKNGERAEKALEIFAKAFCLRNSFHCNGDQSGKGYSNFTYRPFTLEGNFAFAAGVQEMLLQSYSGAIQIFPAIPEDWRDVSFKKLRAEGAFLVSAKREDGKTTEVVIHSETGSPCSLENPFDGDEFKLRGADPSSIKVDGDKLVIAMDKDQTVRLKRKAG
ncbi:MAG: glycoside hydrolase N-terminal domain-containing protein [Candidatus Omnitrophica bacterium]|nr:glycoside hydrolase N-terminal domain-containing protein [Candidatus Omnitrophota bacterium]